MYYFHFMHENGTSEAIFHEAERLHSIGRTEDAALKMTHLICGQSDPHVRERAAALFAKYLGREQISAPELSIRPRPQEVTPPPSPAANGHTKQPVPAAVSIVDREAVTEQGRKSFEMAMRARREQRIANTRIPPTANLPHPLTKHLRDYLRMSLGTSFQVPAELVATLDTVEERIRHLPDNSTRADVCNLLRSIWERCPDSPVAADIFAALVTIIYASDYIDADDARELTGLAPASSQGRTIRELLEDDD